MRLLEYLFALLALVGLVAASWWGVYQSPQNAANLQLRLQYKTSSALTAAGMDWAVVKMDGQHAVLSGKAPSPEAVHDAALVVLGADGKGGLIFGGVTQIENAADSAPPVSPYAWRAEKMPDGNVILTGYVPSRAIRKSLFADATTLSGDANVDDRTRLAAGAPLGNWQGIARLGLQQLSQLDFGEVSLVDTKLRVSGVSADEAIRAKVRADVTHVAAPFTGEPVIRGASLWFARLSESGLLLKGNVSSESERREIAAIARKHFSGSIVDEMVIADQTYPGWMEGVRRGLPEFVHFQSGEMDFDPDGAGFLITGLAAPSALEFLQHDLAALTGPYAASITADLTTSDPPVMQPIGSARDACQNLIDGFLAAGSIQFPAGAAVPARESREGLDVLVKNVSACDTSLTFSIAGRADTAETTRANLELGKSRAAFISDFLSASGIESGRLSAIGYGPDAAEQANDSSDTRSDSRRIKITVLERSE